MRTAILWVSLVALFTGCPDPGDDDMGDDDDTTGTDDDIGDDDDVTGDDDTTGQPDDQDGDGFTPDQGDCNDGDASVFPGAPDTPCDQVDSDCDGLGVGVEAVIDGVEFATDAEAVAAAEDGDTILLCPGVHTEQIYIDADRVLDLGSWSGDPEDTILDGQDDHTCLYVGLNAVISVQDLTFQHGWAEPWVGGDHYGGGIMSRALQLAVSNCVFRNNYSDGNGAGVGLHVETELDSGMTASVEDTVFEDNEAISHGAGVAGNGFLDVSVTVARCVFERNHVSGDGGAVRIGGWSSPNLTISDTAFSDNTSEGHGGAIYTGTPYAPGTTTINNNTFTNNSATHDGGAIYASNQVSFELVDSSFEENQTGYGGAGLLLEMAEESPSGSILNCRFSDNVAGYEGGGLCVRTDRAMILSLEDTEFTGNTASAFGGGMKLDLSAGDDPAWASSVQLTRVTVSGCQASYNGGGIHTSGRGHLDFDSCTLEGNSADDSGGSAMNIRDDAGATFTSCVIDGNDSPVSGAAIWSSGTGGITLIDSAVTANIGGGVGIHRDSSLASENTDWGTGATDNDAYDVWMWEQDVYYTGYGAGETFTCEGTGVCL